MTDFNESKLSKIMARRIIAPADRANLLPFATPIYCPDNNGVKASRVSIVDPNANTFFNAEDFIALGAEFAKQQGKLVATKQPGTINNTVDIDLDQPLNLKYFIPNEVDLKTNVDLLNVIKSDFAVKFKHAVSTQVRDQIQALVTANKLPKIEMQATLSDAIGSAIAKIIKDGTGQKFSIYKYNNGAPIEYFKKNNQPNIDKVIDNTANQFDYATIDDINVPALYYIEKPSLILDNNKFEAYQQGLCSGAINKYVKEVIDVDTTADTLTGIGEGIFGTNDCFAVAFTQPSIKRKPSQEFFGDELYISIYFGVKLVNISNLTVFA